MGFLKKLGEAIGIEDIDEDDLDIEEEESEKKEFIKPATERATLERPEAPYQAPSQRPAPRESMRNTRFTGTVTSSMIVVEPSGFEDCPKLVDNLKAKKPVIINLENIETDVARKIFDFLSGATYALSGKVQKVANNIFLFAPENVDVAYNMNKKAAENESIKNPWK